MEKYDMCICRCGKIHMIPSDKIDDAIEHNKNFMFICADCGSATVVGADKEWDEYEPDKKCYMMYSGSVDLFCVPDSDYCTMFEQYYISQNFKQGEFENGMCK